MALVVEYYMLPSLQMVLKFGVGNIYLNVEVTLLNNDETCIAIGLMRRDIALEGANVFP